MTEELDKIEAEQHEGLGEGAEIPKGDEPPGEQLPPYMQEEPPEGKVNIIKWSLLHGATEEDLKADPSHNSRTVDICAQELEKEGLRKRPPKPPKEPPGSKIQTTNQAGKGTQVFAKGSPPEALIEGMDLPVVDGQIVGFESGMKFGAKMVVMGVRIAQELSALGIQQVKPLIELARDARSGEEAAAKNAATEAAVSAAAMIQQNLTPYLANMTKPAEANPMQGMMVRTMEPIIQRLMGGLIPGMGPQQAQGWTRKQE